MLASEWPDLARLQSLCDTHEPRFGPVPVSCKLELADVGESDPMVVDGVIPPDLSRARAFGSPPV